MTVVPARLRPANIERTSSEIDLAQFVNKLVRIIEPRHGKVAVQSRESYRSRLSITQLQRERERERKDGKGEGGNRRSADSDDGVFSL